MPEAQPAGRRGRLHSMLDVDNWRAAALLPPLSLIPRSCPLTPSCPNPASSLPRAQILRPCSTPRGHSPPPTPP
eukprot:229099-Chlamydomonas_euryale.AAC.15